MQAILIISASLIASSVIYMTDGITNYWPVPNSVKSAQLSKNVEIPWKRANSMARKNCCPIRSLSSDVAPLSRWAHWLIWNLRCSFSDQKLHNSFTSGGKALIFLQFIARFYCSLSYCFIRLTERSCALDICREHSVEYYAEQGHSIESSRQQGDNGVHSEPTFKWERSG